MNVLSSSPAERVFKVAENDFSVCWLRSNMTAGIKFSATWDASIMASQLNKAVCRDWAEKAHSLPWASTTARHVAVLIHLPPSNQIFIRVDANVIASIFIVRIDNPLCKGRIHR